MSGRPMRIKIISDGTPHGTCVVDADTGAIVRGVTHVSWDSGSPGDVPTARVEFIKVPVEIIADLNGEFVETTEIGDMVRHYAQSTVPPSAGGGRMRDDAR